MIVRRPGWLLLAAGMLAGPGLWVHEGWAAAAAPDPSSAFAQDASPVAPETSAPSAGLGALKEWDDGMAEMSYYAAAELIYGRSRPYTRVQIVNRQWQGRSSGVKVDPDDRDAVPVLKLNVAEEIPTENYNYRFLTTLFVERESLRPVKMVVSSQEWCGATYKHLRWQGDELNVQSFSYFPGEGEQTWRVPAEAVPYEALVLIARDVAAAGRSRPLRVLAPMRSNRAVTPEVRLAMLEPGPVKVHTVPAGSFEARRVDLRWDGPPTFFTVETRPPYRLLAYAMSDASGELRITDRRAYWDRKWGSAAYRPNAAP